MGTSSAASESQLLNLGLKFGQEIYFEDVGIGVEAKSGGGGGRQKKGKTGVGVQGQQPPRCQVEGCNLDLSDAKTYYSRHKVCGVHSKTPKVIVNGLEQRFCQQCSRFHQLLEFDQGKRSCRRRLADHNERRRKPPLGTMLSTCYATLPSEHNGRTGGILMHFSSCPRRTVQWPNTQTSNRVVNNPPTSVEKLPPLPWQSNLDNPPPHCPNVPPRGCFPGVSDSNCALSLLSNQSSGSRTQTLSFQYYVNACAGAHMTQPAGEVMDHYSSTNSWGEVHVGSDQILQSDYSGEVGLGQQSRSRYNSSAEHIH